MPQIFKRLHEVRPGEKIVIVDEEIIKKFPMLHDKGLVCSVVKWSGRRLFFQYTTADKKSQTLKLNRSDVRVEVLEKTDIKTLAMFLKEHRYQMADKQPTSVTVITNGRESTYQISPEFWRGNPTNLRIKGLRHGLSNYTVPGSSTVTEFKF